MNWIFLSLTASVFFAFRYVIVKLYLKDVNTLLLAFITRFFGTLFLLPLLFFFEIPSFDTVLFWKIVMITALLTGLASVMQLFAIQKYEMSSSVPFLSFIPIFMVFTVYFFFKEVPGIKSLWGVILLCFGGFIINLQYNRFNGVKRTIGFIKNRGALLFLGVALIFGITTTLDRFAIDVAGSGAFAYTFYWHIVSTIIFLFVFLKKKIRREVKSEMAAKSKYLVLQSLLGIMAFLAQMLAVENAHKINANVLLIKALTLLYILFSVILGIIIFKERNILVRIAGSMLMLTGATIIILHAV